MGIKSDCISSILLCAEDNNSILTFDVEEDTEKHWSYWSFQRKSSDFYDRFFMDFPLLSDECLGMLMKREIEHQPRKEYAKRLMSGCMDFLIRRDAIDWILKVHAYHSFGPLSAYRAVNYLDRFLSSYELPVGETKFVFEARTIQRMELLLLSTLKWRMQAVTPFSFIDYFLHKLNGDNSPSKISVAQAVELIVCTIQGIDFLEFRPSEIAVGVALTVLGKAQPLDVMEAIAYCNKLDKERVLRCYEVIQEEIINGCEDPISGLPSVLSLPQSPIGVLDAACLSYKNDELASGSQSSRHLSSPAAKRRKKSRSTISLCGTETPF